MNSSSLQRPSDGLGESMTRLFVATIIPVVGLFFLRLVLASLPMIKNAAPISDLNVTPLVLIKAALDSVIYFLILRFAWSASEQLKRLRPHLAEIASVILLTGCAVVATLAYSGYEILMASLAPGQMDVYNWLFLAIVLVPVALIVIIATRRMDLFTELLFGKLSSAVAAPQMHMQSAAAAGAQADWRAAGPPAGAPPEAESGDHQMRQRMVAIQQQVASARQAADKLRARGALGGETAESLSKMEGYLDGAAKNMERRDWVKAKSFADWAEYEANRIVTAAN